MSSSIAEVVAEKVRVPEAADETAYRKLVCRLSKGEGIALLLVYLVFMILRIRVALVAAGAV